MSAGEASAGQEGGEQEVARRDGFGDGQGIGARADDAGPPQIREAAVIDRHETGAPETHTKSIHP